jgi:serpin B
MFVTLLLLGAVAHADFDFEMYRAIRPPKMDENSFCSPLSAKLALAVVNGGAKGETEKQLTAALGANIPDMNAITGSAGDDTVLRIANRVWVQKSYKLTERFDAMATRVDFAETKKALREINGWVEEQTGKRIKDLVPPSAINKDTRMIVTNAVYLKAKWAEPFEHNSTHDDDFHLASGKRKSVPMMNQSSKFAYAENRDFQYLKLPYRGGELSMEILLPKQPGGFVPNENAFDAKAVDGLAAKASRHKVALNLPKFKVEQTMELNEPLKAMGIADAFNPKRADFSGITGNKELYIDKVIQKTFVQVDEEGTEAAAATAVIMMKAAMFQPEKIVEFRADHPFFFLIRHERTKAVLFMGRVADPSQ